MGIVLVRVPIAAMKCSGQKVDEGEKGLGG